MNNKSEFELRAFHKATGKIFAVLGIKLVPKFEVSLFQDVYIPADEVVLMRPIGLLDHNGVHIYEGDILRIGKDLIEEVKWIDVGDWMSDKQPIVGFISHSTIYKNIPIKIIGNIHQNPELIK